MKKWWKQMVILILVLSLMLPCFGMTVHATGGILSESERLLLVEALRDIEPQKATWGLSDIDFCDLCVGNPVQTYDYINNTLEPNRELYPIIANGQLVLWAIAHNGQYQLTNGLVKEVSNIITNDTPFALLYDADCVYIYANDTVTLLSKFAFTIDTRSTIVPESSLSDFEINTVSFGEGMLIGYRMTPRMSGNVWCYVDFVPQGNYRICWAATVACIYNYINNLEGSAALDAVTVARREFGASFNKGIYWENISGVLNAFDIDYVGASVASLDPLNAADIHASVMNGYPAFGWFDALADEYHAVTIYGSNVLAGRMVVMDPNSGSHTVTLNANGDYSYVSNVTNDTYILLGAFYDCG